MPLPPTLARWLVEQGHDAVHASEIEMSHAADAQILDRAVAEDRIIVTADLNIRACFRFIRAQSLA